MKELKIPLIIPININDYNKEPPDMPEIKVVTLKGHDVDRYIAMKRIKKELNDENKAD